MKTFCKYFYPITYILFVTLTCLGVYATNLVDKRLNKKIDALYDLNGLQSDCRFQLHMYVARDRGDIKPIKNPNTCHINPLDKSCACAVWRKANDKYWHDLIKNIKY